MRDEKSGVGPPLSTQHSALSTQHFALSTQNLPKLAVQCVLPGLDVKANPQCPQFFAAESAQAQLDQVLLGGDHNTLRVQSLGPGAQVLNVRSRVGVMVGKRS